MFANTNVMVYFNDNIPNWKLVLPKNETKLKKTIFVNQDNKLAKKILAVFVVLLFNIVFVLFVTFQIGKIFTIRIIGYLKL